MRLLEVAALGALGSIIVVCGGGAFLEYKLYKGTQGVKVAPLLAQANLDLQEAHRLVLEAALTAEEARKASSMEVTALPQLTAGVQATLGSANEAVLATRDVAVQLKASAVQITADSSAVLHTANTTVAGLGNVEASAVRSIDQIELSTSHLDVLLSDPDIPIIVSNLHATSVNLTATTGSVKDTAADVQQAVHSYLHPTLAVKIYHAIANTGVEVGKFFF